MSKSGHVVAIFNLLEMGVQRVTVCVNLNKKSMTSTLPCSTANFRISVGVRSTFEGCLRAVLYNRLDGLHPTV